MSSKSILTISSCSISMLVHFLRHSVRRSSLSLLQNLIDWLTDWLTDRLTKFCQVQSLLWVIHLILLHFVFAISYWFVHTLTHTLFNCCVPAIPRLSSCTQWFLISIYPFHHLSLDSCLYMLKPVYSGDTHARIFYQKLYPELAQVFLSV